jgi:hypothetical protein
MLQKSYFCPSKCGIPFLYELVLSMIYLSMVKRFLKEPTLIPIVGLLRGIYIISVVKLQFLKEPALIPIVGLLRGGVNQ